MTLYMAEPYCIEYRGEECHSLATILEIRRQVNPDSQVPLPEVPLYRHRLTATIVEVYGAPFGSSVLPSLVCPSASELLRQLPTKAPD